LQDAGLIVLIKPAIIYPGIPVVTLHDFLRLFIAIDGIKIAAAICPKQPPLLYRFMTVYTQFANKIMKRGNYIL